MLLITGHTRGRPRRVSVGRAIDGGGVTLVLIGGGPNGAIIATRYHFDRKETWRQRPRSHERGACGGASTLG
jgi:hypothetical protein